MPGQRVAKGAGEQRQPVAGMGGLVDRLRFAFGPWQAPLADPFAHPDDVHGDQHDQESAGDIGGAGAKGIDHGAGQRGGYGDAQDLPARCQRAAHRAFLFLQDIDGQPVNRDILKHGRGVDSESDDAEDQHIVRARVDHGKGDQQGDHHRLRADDPHPPPAHRQQCVAVHDKAGDKFEAPRDADHRHDKGDIRRRGAVDRHPRRDGEVEQAKRDPLAGIEQEDGEQAQIAILSQGKRWPQAGWQGNLFHAISPDKCQGEGRPLPRASGAGITGKMSGERRVA